MKITETIERLVGVELLGGIRSVESPARPWAPRPRGATLFGDRLPADNRVTYGVDLAYTAKTSADGVCRLAFGSEGFSFDVDMVTPSLDAGHLYSLLMRQPKLLGRWRLVLEIDE